MFRDPNRVISVDGKDIPGYFPVDGLQRVTMMNTINRDALIPYVEVDVDGTIQVLREEFGK